MTKTQETTASEPVSTGLRVPIGDPIIERRSELQSGISGEKWGVGFAHYSLKQIDDVAAARVLEPREILSDDLEPALSRRITSYRECIRARSPRPEERRIFKVPAETAMMEVQRTANSTTAPISFFIFCGRSDRLEADYVVEA
jgi:DNA-binding GntR family transcriptional regulator